MGKRYQSLRSLLNDIKKDVEKGLEVSVGKRVVEIEVEHIKKDVYDAYSPNTYDRRGTDGGLLDEDNILITKVDHKTIVISNETYFNPFTKPDGSYYNNPFPSYVDLAELIEDGYTILNGGHMEARPFTENTIKDLNSNKQHVKALKKFLETNGYKIE